MQTGDKKWVWSGSHEGMFKETCAQMWTDHEVGLQRCPFNEMWKQSSWSYRLESRQAKMYNWERREVLQQWRLWGENKSSVPRGERLPGRPQGGVWRGGEGGVLPRPGARLQGGGGGDLLYSPHNLLSDSQENSYSSGVWTGLCSFLHHLHNNYNSNNHVHNNYNSTNHLHYDNNVKAEA